MPIATVINDLQSQVPVKIWTDDVELKAITQLRRMSQLPFIHKHIAAMPDVHWGLGATIGSVIPCKGAVIPAAVGVDLGCGMMAHKLDLTAKDLPDNLHELRCNIEAAVPHGRTNHGDVNDRGAWNTIPIEVLNVKHLFDIREGLASVIDRHPSLLKGRVNIERHLGTLGGGNHFIEVCLDEKDGVWVVLHTGSRGIGNRIGTYFINLAKQDMKKWFINIPDVDLAYFPQNTEHFADYLTTVGWAQDFAQLNRQLIMNKVLKVIEDTLGRAVNPIEGAIECHHNYIAREKHYGESVIITRKGAIRAREGDRGIIPGSMGARTYIVRGLGNRESFCSCSHGAGRSIGRAEAKRRYTAEDLAKQTEGIECPKDATRVDEIPSAYKSIEKVMENQKDLVEVEYILKQVINIKG